MASAAAFYHYIQCCDDNCNQFSIDNIKMLLADKSFNPIADNYYAIRLACYYSRIEILELLFQNPRVNPKGEKGICWTIEEDYQEAVRLELKSGKVAIIVVTNEDYINIIYPEYTRDIHEEIKEKYLLWKYRIGGDKYNSAKNDFQQSNERSEFGLLLSNER